MKYLRNLILSLGALFVLSGAGGVAIAAYNPLDKACNKANVSDSATCQDSEAQSKSSDNPVIKILGWFTRVFSIIIGFAAVIMIVVSGLSLITSSGNTESVAGAKKRLTAAVIGLAIASLAWLIASYLLNQIL